MRLDVIRPHLRLVATALALVPVAIVARALGSDWLTEFVQRYGALAWKRYDSSR